MKQRLVCRPDPGPPFRWRSGARLCSLLQEREMAGGAALLALRRRKAREKSRTARRGRSGRSWRARWRGISTRTPVFFNLIPVTQTLTSCRIGLRERRARAPPFPHNLIALRGCKPRRGRRPLPQPCLARCEQRRCRIQEQANRQAQIHAHPVDSTRPLGS